MDLGDRRHTKLCDILERPCHLESLPFESGTLNAIVPIPKQQRSRGALREQERQGAMTVVRPCLVEVGQLDDLVLQCFETACCGDGSVRYCEQVRCVRRGRVA